VGIALVAILVLLVGAAAFALFRHERAIEAVDAEWEARKVSPLGDIGTTRTLTLLPLVDWHAARDDLQTDVGVSYLVKTDHATILFDTGNNSKNADPSPLEHNMEALGVSLDAIDSVVISHAHFDHTGGTRWTDGDLAGTTFGIGNAQPPLGDKLILTAIDMTYPGSVPQTATQPTRVADGVATTGTIPRRLFGHRIDEQALAVNVEGRGIVLVVGCGHQTLTRLIEHTEAVFDAPLWGVVGGLHYPVPEGRITIAGLNLQRLLASGNGPHDPLDTQDVDRELALLRERDVGLVAISGHDSSDEVIENARRQFGKAHRYVRVGHRIVLP
jgi:metal-dependent hydrolase (beta-lactamase superfamily II)